MSKLVSQSYGVRFDADTHARIRAKAAKEGISETKAVRNAATESLMQPSLSYLLKQLEHRMLNRNFEMNCIIVGLNEQQRQQAAQQCNIKFGQEIL
jgi:hypothetical protein